MQTWDRQTFNDYVVDKYGTNAADVLEKVNLWVARGDGAAVYENAEIGHPGMGLCQIASFGSSAAQLETDVPPERLPDMDGLINWRYVLVATYRPG